MENLSRAALASCCLWASGARADQYHYSNVLLGARAQALGGAFTALADDASGVAYNPGGTAFAKSGDLSLSGATFYQRRTSYSKVIGESDFEEKARGAVSSFLGGLTRIGAQSALSGLTLGFALSTPDAGLVDENTTLSADPEARLLHYHRTQSTRGATLHAAASAAIGIGKTFGFGVSGGYFDIDEVTVIYQDVLQGPYSFNETGTQRVNTLASINSRTSLSVGGIEAGAGARWSPSENLHLGLTGKLRRLVRQRYGSDRDAVRAWVDDNGAPVVGSGSDDRFDGTLKRDDQREAQGEVFGGWPGEIRAGLALSSGKALTWTLDAIHVTAGPSSEPGLARAAVTNLASGLEGIWFSRVVTRAGAFTNFDATVSRNPLDASSRGEHIDYLGVSGGIAFRFKSSEYGAVYVQQWGRGKAEKAPDVESSVTSRVQLLTFTASQGL